MVNKMTEEEFRNKNVDFIKALEERCMKEGLSFKYSCSPFGEVFCLVGNEVYILNNDGNTASWRFAGYGK